MPRTASGSEVLEQAQQALREAKTVEELRQAQAVVLPLVLGVSIEQTAAVLGVSVGWACQLRRRFITAGHLVPRKPAPPQGPRAYMSRTEEEAFLAPFIERASQGQIVVAAEIRAAFEQLVGRRTAPATIYYLLKRHGWRKLVPDRVHPQSSAPAQKRWKKRVAQEIG